MTEESVYVSVNVAKSTLEVAVSNNKIINRNDSLR